MRWTEAQRESRLHEATKKDQRLDFERDRDRVLYSTAFHRLAGVTQVVRAGEHEVVHNRQQHSLKVAQIGRRLAQRCINDFPNEVQILGVHPEVVEAACLAHDLGHPPFGHVGEHVLDELTKGCGDPDGFEGNAQTFRILVKLGIRFEECDGLDLTRATLAAVLKYPWLRQPGNPNKEKKWSAYRVDVKDFEFAREFHQHDFRTAEAALMDWADDVAYSVHDLEDFHRCGAIPWTEIFDEGARDRIVDNAYHKWHGAPSDALTLLMTAFSAIEDLFLYTYEYLIYERYVGSRSQRLALRNLTSSLIGRYINAASLVDSSESVIISPNEQAQVIILKQIFRDFIISSPALKAQQRGQEKLIRDLHSEIYSASSKDFPDFLPVKLRYFWDICEGERPRFAADCIASLTEREVVGLHGRLFGSSDSSVLDPIVR